jgi:acyl-CoA synthetase (AMP-forming)/AMP-acid ligase II
MIYSLLENSAKLYPNNVVLCTDNYKCTYYELNENVKRIAKGLLSKKLKKGDRIASYLYNCPQAIELCFACFKIGICVVMIHPSLREYEISLLLKESEPKLFVTQFELYEKNIKNLIHRFSFIKNYYLVDLQDDNNNLLHFSNLIINNNNDEEKDNIQDEINGEQEATIFDTSGSTGKSKCVLSNHQSIIAMVNGYDIFNFDDKSTLLLVSSMNICIGFYATILPAIKHGSCIYYFSSNLSYNDYIKKIAQILYEKTITYLCITTSTWEYVINELKMNYIDIKNKIDLRYCIFCGEKCSPFIYEKTKEYLGFYPIEGYGMTECDIIGLAPFDEYFKTNSIPKIGTFKPFGDKKVRITNWNDWNDLPINTLGEITIYSKANMICYLNDEEATQQVLQNGWFKTGDIGYIDENDYLHITSRKKFHIIYNGYNISLVEVETILREHEYINEACITSIHHDHDFELPVAYITLKQLINDDDHTKIIEQIYSYLNEKMATYKIPKYIKILPNLPKTNKTGKVDRQLLAKKALEDFGEKSK